jgi:WhiB family redox-sensing transcriptional regulator
MDEIIDDVARILEVPISEERPWVVFGACRHVDPDLFFSTDPGETEHALSICASCPVRVECLDYALEAGERFGIWGGLTEKRRKTVSRSTA